MALKDLSNTTFPADFMVIINQLGLFLQAFATKDAGPKPAPNPRNPNSSVTISYNSAFNKAGALLISFWRTNIVPLNPSVSINSASTFNKKFVDAATWTNYFFILRTQLLGAVGGNSNDPLIKSMDAVWEEILKVKGTWKIVTKNVKN